MKLEGVKFNKNLLTRIKYTSNAFYFKFSKKKCSHLVWYYAIISNVQKKKDMVYEVPSLCKHALYFV